MKRTSTTFPAVLTVAALLTVGLAGCQSDETDPGMHSDPMAAQSTTREALSRSKLSQAPLAVRNAFMADQPNADGVTSVKTLTAETGALYYEIGYIQDGQVQRVTYDQAGETFDRNPTTRTAPTTQPMKR